MTTDPVFDEGPAWDLHRRILQLADRGHQRALFALAEDSTTDGLLDRLPAAAADRARLHLREARRWAERKRATNRRRLDEARAALDSLDLGLARGLLARLDDAFLDTDARDERDALLLELSARTMEFEDIARSVSPDPPPRRRRWWRRD